ncbi:MAG: Gfo/Idh/MocA family oxidoreductase [Caldilineaceae bacterium]|nr:Gfo/Idh/MocA family oxidoreductase [Caldilineaceae bacterium]
MTTLQKLRHVVVGVGANIFFLHKAALAQLPEAELVGVADINPASGQPRAEELGVPFYLDHQTMLAELKPDVTSVITPHPSHAPIAIDAFNAGSHVLVEKPIAVHVGEADQMIAAAEANDRLLAVNFQHRFRPEVMAIHKLLHEGGLGQILRVTVVEPWHRTAIYFRNAGWRGTWRGEGGGVLMNQAPHGIDLICFLLGMPRRVSAWTRTVHHAIETEDAITAMLEWEGGALGTVYMSTVEAGERRMEITGTAGTLRLGESTITYERYEPDLFEHIATSQNPFGSPARVAATLAIDPQGGPSGQAAADSVGAVAGHDAVYRNFYDAILHGAPIRCDGRQGRYALELANAMLYSSQTNAPVEMPLDREGYAALLTKLQNR